MDELKWIAPSWIDTAEYCEHQLYLEKVVGIRVEDKDTAQGKRKHRERDKEFKERARKVDISPKEIVPLAKRKNKAFELSEVEMSRDEELEPQNLWKGRQAQSFS